MKRRNYGWLAVLSVLGMGLGSGCVPKETGAPISQEQLTGQTQATQYKTVDGWTIMGDLFPTQGTSKGVVVLLHQRGGSADDWSALSLALQQAGYTAFAVDARGHRAIFGGAGTDR